MLINKKMTLAVAESCTGGLISSKITDTPGSSKYFKLAFAFKYKSF
jgi:nicotinamide-nucleotide amidase